MYILKYMYFYILRNMYIFLNANKANDKRNASERPKGTTIPVSLSSSSQMLVVVPSPLGFISVR